MPRQLFHILWHKCRSLLRRGDVMTKLISTIAVVTLHGLSCAAHAGDLYVIAHPLTTLTPGEVRGVFLGEKQFAGSTRLAPVDNSAAQEHMLAKVLNVDSRTYDTLWTKKSFREGINPPVVKSSDIEVIEYVKRTPGAVGYVTSRPHGVNIIHSVNLLPGTVSASVSTEAEEQELKAAFIYNFALFTTWPKPAPDLRLCVLGEMTYVKPLKYYEERNVKGATVRVQHVMSAREARDCQIVFIDASERERMATISKALEGAAVLVVADSGTVGPASAHIILATENGRIVFDINRVAATAAGLDLSFKLLTLARRVYDGK